MTQSGLSRVALQHQYNLICIMRFAKGRWDI